MIRLPCGRWPLVICGFLFVDYIQPGAYRNDRRMTGNKPKITSKHRLSCRSEAIPTLCTTRSQNPDSSSSSPIRPAENTTTLVHRLTYRRLTPKSLAPKNISVLQRPGRSPPGQESHPQQAPGSPTPRRPNWSARRYVRPTSGVPGRTTSSRLHYIFISGNVLALFVFRCEESCRE